MMRFEANNLSVIYDNGSIGLQDVSYACEGNIFCVIGHNGSGKSTLIKSALGLLPPSSGYVSVVNEFLPLLPHKDMMFSPETGAVFSDLSVEAYIRLWCRLKLHDAAYYKKEGAEVLDDLQIEPLLNKLGRELSKGQKRRVQLAVAFLVKPKALFLDEPFDGLDIHQASYLSSIIKRESLKTSIILSSHRMSVVEKVAEQVLVLKEGKLASLGTPSEVSKDLAGNCFLISGAHVSSSSFKVLERGEDCLAVGESLKIEEIQSLTEAKITPVSLTLAIAMEYHLSELETSIID